MDVSFDKHVCEVCHEGFPNSLHLAVHRRNKHPELQTEDGTKPEFCCPHCSTTFTRADSLKRHVEKTCEKNPAVVRSPPQPTAERGSVKKRSAPENVPATSDNGLKSYEELREEHASKLPRINLEDPWIFKKELYCRYPGCTDTNRFSSSKVRRHYEKTHRVVVKTAGAIRLEGKIQHDRGLTWLARCAQLGERDAGEVAPKPTIW